MLTGSLVAGRLAASSAAEPSAMAGRCPGYRAHLQSAQAALARGDRAQAVAALRKAQDALRSCIREEAGGASLLADSSTRPAG